MDTTYQRSADIVARRIGDEVILVPIRNHVGDLRSIYSLNEVGAFIWDRLDGQASADALIDAVCAEFEADPADVARDVAEYLTQLATLGAVSPASDADQTEALSAPATRLAR